MSQNKNTYLLTDVKETEDSIHGKLVLPSDHFDDLPSYGPDLDELAFAVEFQTPYRLRVTISDNEGKRWKVPKEIVGLNQSNNESKDMKYDFGYETSPFGFHVIRKSNGEKLFDTAKQRLVFKDQYIELSTAIPQKSNIYGFGEIVGPLKNEEGKRMTIFTRDAPCPKGENLYGCHPFYIELREGKAHGVLLLNSNGMDIFYEAEKLTYKVIGGILDFYVFLGPTPAEVIEQYSEFVGRPYFVPYWSLAFHQCRWGYDTVKDAEEVAVKYKKAEIPLDTMWLDIDYMDFYKIFTYSPERFPPDLLAEFVERLHQNHQKMVLIVDPGIKVEDGYPIYEEGLAKDLFIKRADGRNFVGSVWPGTTVFPDWFHPETQKFWTDCIARWLDLVPIDGIWLDMNEIANFVNGDISNKDNEGYRADEEMGSATTGGYFVNKLKQMVHSFVGALSHLVIGEKNIISVTNPPYAINNFGNELPLFTRTSPMDGYHYSGILEYNAHNLFGHMEGIATNKALRSIRPNKRPFILSRSTFPGSGKYVAHWLGDNDSSWESLKDSIPGILVFQFFGIPLVGADICGFNRHCGEELATRWVQLGSFYPFCRNHNAKSMSGQEFYVWESVKAVAKKWLGVRYKLLPYWYTGFYKATTKGTPVITPLWFLEPESPNTWAIDQQFLVGKGLLVSPVTKEDCNHVNAYFPPGIWYDFLSGAKVVEGDEGRWMELNAPLEDIPVHVHGGLIIPMHRHAGLTSFESRKSGLQLLIALDKAGNASGELYLDDGETPYEDVHENHTLVHLSVLNSALTAIGSFGYKGAGSFVDQIVVYGVERVGTEILFVNTDTGERKIVDQKQFELNEEIGRLCVRELQILLSGGFTLSWA